MKRLAALLLCPALAVAQSTVPNPTRRQILQNARVTVWQVEVPAHAVASRHEHDALTVIVGGGKAKSKLTPGAVFYTPAGRNDALRNPDAALKAVTVEFAHPQGKVGKPKEGPSRYCNPGSKTACVDEKYLLCTAKICVENVTFGADAITTRHSHETDHMIIAITDYVFADDIVGKGVVTHEVKSGEVNYVPAGVTHTLTNKSGKSVRFVVVVFR